MLMLLPSKTTYFFLRTPTLDEAKVQEMLDFAESLDLNPRGVEYEAGDHTGCWD